MADQHVWRICPDRGTDWDIRASQIVPGSGVVSLQDEQGGILAVINLEKTQAIFRLDQLSGEPK